MFFCRPLLLHFHKFQGEYFVILSQICVYSCCKLLCEILGGGEFSFRGYSNHFFNIISSLLLLNRIFSGNVIILYFE